MSVIRSAFSLAGSRRLLRRAASAAAIGGAALLIACGSGQSGASLAADAATLAWSSPSPAVLPVAERPRVQLPTRSNYVGTNLSGIAYWSTEFPFVDLMKSGMGWVSVLNGAWTGTFPSMRNGYPTSLLPGQKAVAAVAWGNTHYPAGQYVVLWDGDGSISFPLSTVKVVRTEAHRIVLDISDTNGSLWVGIDRTNPADPVRNLRFLWPGSEATYATQPFNPAFLQKIAPFSTLRFMDWGGTNGSPVVEWADRAHVADVMYATPKGVPLELMIDLANTLHVDPWFCIPHLASDDYMRQFATLLHARLDPALKPHIEYSNEVWNTGFEQTRWANAQSDKLGLQRPWGTPSEFYAQRSVEMFKIFRQVWAADSARLVRVIAGQAAWTQFLEHALAWKDTAANADVVAIAPYFNAAGTDDPAKVDATLALTSDQVVDRMLQSIRGDMASNIARSAALARKYKLTLKAYESGVGDTTFQFPADKQDRMTALYTAANRNPRMRDVYKEAFGTWVANGGDTMNQFNDIGGWSKWGFWSLLEYVTQDPATSPKYSGVLDFIAQHPTRR